jgi:predicted regulator of Ras-like GTPase activity (Roadblock/LC7/MglB family)
MSVESRSPLRGLRRATREPEHLDYSEPDFSSWAARLADYTPTRQVVVTEPAVAPVLVPMEANVVETSPVAVAVALDERPSLEAVLQKLLSFDGALCVAVVDSESGMILGKAGADSNIDLAAAGASTILRARLASTRALGTNEKIDDVLISLTSQVQIIHPLPSNPSIFTYLIGDKAKASLAMARYKATEADLLIQL